MVLDLVQYYFTRILVRYFNIIIKNKFLLGLTIFLFWQQDCTLGYNLLIPNFLKS